MTVATVVAVVLGFISMVTLRECTVFVTTEVTVKMSVEAPLSTTTVCVDVVLIVVVVVA